MDGLLPAKEQALPLYEGQHILVAVDGPSRDSTRREHEPPLVHPVVEVVEVLPLSRGQLGDCLSQPRYRLTL